MQTKICSGHFPVPTLFIHSGFFYSAKSTTTHSCSQLQRWYCDRVNTPKRYRQLRVKDSPKVPTWWLEWDLEPATFCSAQGNKPTTELPCVAVNRIVNMAEWFLSKSSSLFLLPCEFWFLSTCICLSLYLSASVYLNVCFAVKPIYLLACLQDAIF